MRPYLMALLLQEVYLLPVEELNGREMQSPAGELTDLLMVLLPYNGRAYEKTSFDPVFIQGFGSPQIVLQSIV
jgi:hypothetical protein